MLRSGVFHMFLAAALLLPMPSHGLAATGRILDDNEATLADATALAAEAEVFESIGIGIALAIYHCEGQNSCVPHVSKAELDHLLSTLDKRISELANREQEQQGTFTDVITTYVTHREDYLRYKSELEKYGFGDEAMAETGGHAGIDLSIFSDADAPLEDEPLEGEP